MNRKDIQLLTEISMGIPPTQPSGGDPLEPFKMGAFAYVDDYFAEQYDEATIAELEANIQAATSEDEVVQAVLAFSSDPDDAEFDPDYPEEGAAAGIRQSIADYAAQY